MKKVSVILATYNGEAFIEEQLLSLLLQNMAADEVLIRDDCSSDKTVEVIEKFIAKHQLNHWVIKKNECNLGWRETFKILTLEANNDIIFYCDQDDKWHMNKIEQMVLVFENNPEVWVLSCNYHPFFSDNFENKEKYLRRWKKIQANKDDGILTQVEANNENLFSTRIGCSLAFRKNMQELFSQIWVPNYYGGHDHAMFNLGMSLENLYIINLILFEYRKHGESTIAREKISKGDVFDSRINEYLQQSEFTLKLSNLVVSVTGNSKVSNWLRRISDFKMYRSKVLIHRRYAGLVQYVSRFHNLKSLIMDFYLINRFGATYKNEKTRENVQ